MSTARLLGPGSITGKLFKQGEGNALATQKADVWQAPIDPKAIQDAAWEMTG